MDTSPTSWSKQHQFLAETKSLSSQVLKTFMNGDHTTVLQSFPRLHCLRGEQTFLYTRVQTSHFNLCPLPLIVPPWGTLGPGSIFLGASCRCWRAALWPSPRHCLLQAKQAHCLRPCVSALVFDHLHNPCTIPLFVCSPPWGPGMM